MSERNVNTPYDVEIAKFSRIPRDSKNPISSQLSASHILENHTPSVPRPVAVKGYSDGSHIVTYEDKSGKKTEKATDYGEIHMRKAVASPGIVDVPILADAGGTAKTVGLVLLVAYIIKSLKDGGVEIGESVQPDGTVKKRRRNVFTWVDVGIGLYFGIYILKVARNL